MHRIPLHARDGSVRAHALIDDDVVALLGHTSWSLDAEGYVRTQVGGRKDRRTIYLHRLVLGLERGDGKQADHEDGNRLDNRRSNLRLTDRAGNAQNQIRVRSRSGYRGVTWHAGHGKWMAHARLDGKQHTLGYHDDPKDAAAQASAWRLAHMPFSVETAAA